MKKQACLSVAVWMGLTSSVVASVQAPTLPEPRPTQLIMRARASWMKAMNENLAARMLAEVAKDADALAAQAGKVAQGAEGEPRTLHQKVADLATAVSMAAHKGEEDLVRSKLGEIKDTCTECHTKFRPK